MIDRCVAEPRRGFTLIEVLVVVAIIALLTAILLPSLANVREQSRRTVCATQLQQFGHGILMYGADFRDSLPGPVHAAVELETSSLAGSFEYDGWHLPSFIRRYMGERGRKPQGNTTDAVASCPTALRLSQDKLKNKSLSSIYRTFTYAINNSLKNYSSSILFGTDPPWYFGYPNDFWENTPAPFRRISSPTQYTKFAHPKKISMIRQAAREWAIADAFTYYTLHNGSAVPNPLPLNGRQPGQWQYGTYWLYTWAANPNVNLPDRPYHSKGLNQLCFDGHVEYQREWRGTVNSQ